MRRREVLTLIGGVAAWPLASRSESKRSAIIGFVHSGSPGPAATALAAFRNGLAAQGYVEGANLAFEYRWAHDDYDRLPAFFAELVNRSVAVIAAMGGPIAAVAAKAATATVPIVFAAVADPVRIGLVASLNRPGGNVTGTAGLTTELDAKRLQLLIELLPNNWRAGALINPNRPLVDAQLSDLMGEARKLGIDLVTLRAGTETELQQLGRAIRDHGLQAVIVTADPFFVNQAKLIASQMSQASVPAVYHWREQVMAGGLMSYGPSRAEAYHQAGIYAGRILNGEKPADLPVVQPTKFELIINSKTAATLGLVIPSSLLARADELIE